MIDVEKGRKIAKYGSFYIKTRAGSVKGREENNEPG